MTGQAEHKEALKRFRGVMPSGVKSAKPTLLKPFRFQDSQRHLVSPLSMESLMLTRLLPIAVLFFLSGCLGNRDTEILRVDVNDLKTSGARYYLAQPYLIVHPNGESSIEMLQDPNQMYTVIPGKSLFGSSEVSLTVTSGTILQSVSGKTDQKFAETLKAAGSVVSSVAPLLLRQSPGEQTPTLPPGLYKIDVPNNTIQKVRVQP